MYLHHTTVCQKDIIRPYITQELHLQLHNLDKCIFYPCGIGGLWISYYYYDSENDQIHDSCNADFTVL